jgi:hypothetical protein
MLTSDELRLLARSTITHSMNTMVTAKALIAEKEGEEDVGELMVESALTMRDAARKATSEADKLDVMQSVQENMDAEGVEYPDV